MEGRNPTPMKLFAVVRTQGETWRPSASLENQPDWQAHASFMNGLQQEGFVVLGGPLDGTPDVLLIVRANSADEIIERLAADPWSGQDLLRISRISPWTLRLGSLS
jgi:uncharacterized protein YciI